MMDTRLLQAADDGALILTVNDRLSRHLHQEYDRAQQHRGAGAWTRPEIISCPAWLMRRQKRDLGALTILNGPQLQRVWESIIEQDMQSSNVELLHVPQTARRARQAYQLLVSYNADFGSTEAAEDHLAFLRWRRAWQQISNEKQWHDPASVPWLLSKSVAEGKITLPKQIVFAGFDEITPDILNLKKALEHAGSHVEYWSPEPCHNVIMSELQAVDPADEVNQCARWARRVLQQNPCARIGVVVPQLEAYQGLVARIFAAELEPAGVLEAEEEVRAFNLSLGKQLDTEEIVFAALRLLRCSRQIKQSELSWLMHTPYLSGGSAEAFSRAKLDRELQCKRVPVWQTSRLAKTVKGLENKLSYSVPKFRKVLNALAEETRQNRKCPPGDWAEHFSLFLQKLGWPGERGLSSREYQAVDSFKEELGMLASLDSVSKTLSRSEAVQLLAQLVSAKPFQPEGKGAPVQVVGILESAGLAFDHMWILGLHDRALPSAPGPNPFIPPAIQSRYKMKRADTEREYLFAERVVQRLFSAAPEVVLSWPVREDDAPLRKSPFVPQGLPEFIRCDLTEAPTALIYSEHPTLDVCADEHGPPLPPRRTFSGGTGILKDQALCPFRAFAHYRLRAEQADRADIGIDNMSRGTLAHTALELFWASVEDHSRLLSLQHQELVAHVVKAVEGALDRLERENRHDLPQKQRRIEAARLQILVESWLDIERARQDFTVLAAEKNQQIAIGELVIRTRIDRIDRLADGSHAIIDYKTGLPDPSQWLDVRMTEPQLPAYCLTMPREQVGAVMFGVVRGKEKERGFKGLARNIEVWPGAKSKNLDRLLEEQGWADFDRILEHWQNTLNKLGDAFAQGDARVDPVDIEKACKYCDLKVLCRIAEKNADWQEIKDG